jgi:hypothetical protein
VDTAFQDHFRRKLCVAAFQGELLAGREVHGDTLKQEVRRIETLKTQSSAAVAVAVVVIVVAVAVAVAAVVDSSIDASQ